MQLETQIIKIDKIANNRKYQINDTIDFTFIKIIFSKKDHNYDLLLIKYSLTLEIKYNDPVTKTVPW